MRGAFLVILFISLVIVIFLVLKDIHTKRTEATPEGPGVDEQKAMERAKDAARRFESATKDRLNVGAP